MTSPSGAASLLDELRFAGGGGRRGTAAAPRWQLDFDSTLGWPDLPYDSAAPATHYPPARQAALAAVLDDAMDTLRARAPAAATFVDAQLDHVLLRRDERSPGASSGSHRLHVGRCILTNLDSADAPRGIAVEALVHEAIHQHLYRLEQRERPFCDLAETPLFRSPWTGARLPLHSLVHAAFVWFGLANLWAAVGARSGTDTAADAAWARARASHGLFGHAFLEDLLDAPGFPLERIDPAALAALRRGASALRESLEAAERPAATLAQLAALRGSAEWSVRVHAALTA